MGEKIKQLRKAYRSGDGSRLSQEALGNAIGVHRQVVVAWEKGSYSPSPENLQALAKFFQVPIGELTGNYQSRVADLLRAGAGLVMDSGPGSTPRLPVADVPIVGRVAASGVDYAPDEPPRGTLPFPMYGPARGRLEALQVAGDSMAPKIPDGSFVILKSRDFFKSGDVAVVRVDGQVLLKKVVVDGEKITLECFNKRHRSLSYAAKAVEILATVHEVHVVVRL